MVDQIENNEGLGSVREKLNEIIASTSGVFTAITDGLVPAPGAPTGRALLDDATWGTVSGLPPDGDYGSVTVSGGGTVWTVDVDAIALSQLADIAANSILGNISGAPNNPQALTATQVTSMLDSFTSALKGLVPASGGGTANFLRADGTWAAAGGGGGTPGGSSGQIQYNNAGAFGGYTMSGDATITTGGVLTLSNSSVSLGKMADVATASVFYRKTAGTGTPEVQTLATLKTDLGLTGTNSGDQTITLTGDVTGSGTGSFAATLATVNSNVGSWGLAASVAQFTVNAKGLITAAANVAISIASTAISDATTAGRAMLTAATAAAQTALLDVFTSGAKGLAPASGGGTANFLRADGTWNAPTATISDGDKGDVIVSGGGTVWSLDYTAVNAVIAPVFANNTAKPTTVAGYGISDALTITGAQSPTNKTFDNTNTVTLKDNLFTLQDDGDVTKQARFQLSGITTGNVRSYLLPDNTGGTIILDNVNQTMSGQMTFSNATNNFGTSTGTSFNNLGVSATTGGTTKTVAIGTAGLSTSITNISIGSAVAGALGTLTINSPTVVFGANLSAFNMPDAHFFLQDQTDATKQAQFQLSGITTGTTRTMTIPDASGTLALNTVFTSGADGLAPLSGGGTSNYLRADGTWAVPPGTGGGISDGDKGDVIVSGGGTVWSLDYTAVNAVIAPVFANITSTPTTLSGYGITDSATLGVGVAMNYNAFIN